MKALGLGLGAVRVPRRRGRPRRARRPDAGAARRRRPSWPGRRGGAVAPLADPHRPRWRWPRWWPTAPGATVGRRSTVVRWSHPAGGVVGSWRAAGPDRRRDAGGRRPGPGRHPARRAGRAGGDGGGRGRPRPAGRRLRPAGRADLRQGQQRGRRTGGGPRCWPGGAPGSPWSAPARWTPSATSGPPVDLVVDAAFGTGFRGTYDAPRVAPGIPVLAVDIPSGVEGDTGAAAGTVLPATATVTFVALQARPGPGRRGAGWPATVRVVDIGLPVDGYAPDRRGRGRRRGRPGAGPRPGRQQVGGRRAGGGRLARA